MALSEWNEFSKLKGKSRYKSEIRNINPLTEVCTAPSSRLGHNLKLYKVGFSGGWWPPRIAVMGAFNPPTQRDVMKGIARQIVVAHNGTNVPPPFWAPNSRNYSPVFCFYGYTCYCCQTDIQVIWIKWHKFWSLHPGFRWLMLIVGWRGKSTKNDKRSKTVLKNFPNQNVLLDPPLLRGREVNPASSTIKSTYTSTLVLRTLRTCSFKWVSRKL